MGSQGSQGQRSISMQLQIVSYFVIHGFNQHYSIRLLKFLLGLCTPYNFQFSSHTSPTRSPNQMDGVCGWKGRTCFLFINLKHDDSSSDHMDIPWSRRGGRHTPQVIRPSFFMVVFSVWRTSPLLGTLIRSLLIVVTLRSQWTPRVNLIN